jgi:hypothetical protein
MNKKEVIIQHKTLNPKPAGYISGRQAADYQSLAPWNFDGCITVSPPDYKSNRTSLDIGK